MQIRPLSRCIVLTDSGTLAFDPGLVAFDGTVGGGTPNPAFSSAPSITHDGTPQVGETLTGIDGTVTNGAVATRQWLLNGSAISGANGATFVPSQTGSYTFRETATGAGGTTPATSTSAAIAVAAATPTPTPTPTIALSSDISQVEGDSGTKLFRYTATLTRNGSTAAYPYTWAVTGTGTNPADAVDFGGALPSGSGTFAAGETVKTIDVLATGDTAAEPDEKFALSLNVPGVGTATANGTIVNDDAAPIVVTPAAYTLNDDFNTAGAINGRPNWTGDGVANYEAANGILRSVDSKGYGAERGTLVYGGDLTDFKAVFGIRLDGGIEGAPAYDPTQPLNFYFWWQDVQNHWRVALRLTSGTGNDGYAVTVTQVVGGNDGLSLRFYGMPLADYVGTKELVVNARGKYIYVALDGVTANYVTGGAYRDTYPSFVPDLDFNNIPASSRHGRIAMTHSRLQGKLSLLDYVGTGDSPLEVTSLGNFAGRTSKTATSGVVPVKGTFTGSATKWAYRLLKASDRTTVQDWRAFTPTITGSTFAGNLTLPIGGPYLVDIAWAGSNDQYYTHRARPSTMCGILVAYGGQSNAVGRNSGYEGARANDQTAVAYYHGVPAVADNYASFPPVTFANRTLAADIAAVRTAEIVAQAAGMPAGVFVTGIGARDIQSIIDDWDNPTWKIAETFNNTTGIVEAFIWDQGDGDSDGAATTPNYVDIFVNNLLPKVRASSRNPDVVTVIALGGRYAANTPANGGPSYDKMDRQREDIKMAHLQCAATAGANTFIASSYLGCDHGTGPDSAAHYNTDGYTEKSRRDGWSAAKAILGGSVHSGLGPLATSATRAGATITLAFDLNGATGLSGPATKATGTLRDPPQPNTTRGYQVSADNFTTLLPISSVERSGNTLVITLAAAPSGSVKIRSFYGASYDDTVLFYGDYADTASIPVAPIITPIAAA